MLIIRNNNEFSVSIAYNTNRAVSSSNDNLGGIKNGTYIKLGDEDNLYSVVKSNRFSYFKKFDLIDSRTIKIKGDIGVNLQPNDSIRISYDEYELYDILEIKNPGELYINGEILTVTGGELSINISEGFGYPTKLKVEEVDREGGILKLSKFQEGKYIIAPKSPFIFNSQSGSGVEINLKYNLIDNKSIINRAIKTIQFDLENNETILGLDYSLPLGITKGNLSTEKFEVFLDKPYLLKTSYGIKYKCFSDFSLNYNFPLIAKNSNCPDILINKSIIELDKIIKGLENRIVELEKQIKK